MELFDLLWVGLIIGVAVMGTHELMSYLQVPQPFIWAIPLAVFAVIVALIVKRFWH